MVPFVPAEYQAKVKQKNEWLDQLQAHRSHPGFRTTQNPHQRTLGFTCTCTEELQSFDIDIVALKRMHHAGRQRAQRIFEADARKGNKARRKKAHKALKRAEALLHRYLTKDQRWSLRAQKSFFVTAKDGHLYEILAAGNNNVVRYDENGKALYRFCIVAKKSIPAYDLMLAQKLLLETNPRSFLDTAVVHNVQTGETWSNGCHIDNPDVVPPDPWQRFRREEAGQVRNRVRQVLAQLEDEGMIERIPNNAEHEQLQAIQEQQAKKPCVGDLLIHDMCLATVAKYDNSNLFLGTSLGFVLTADEEVMTSYDYQIEVPPLDNQDTEGRIIKLVTGIPAVGYKSIAHVQRHFEDHDLCALHVLLNPETDAEWSTWGRPAWPTGDRVLGVKKILDERVPKGRAWYVADPETVGMVVYWYEEPQQGYGIFNLDGVAVYEPPGDQESLQAQEAEDREVHIPALEAAREARLRIPVPNIIEEVGLGRRRDS